jgi:hypothetical protein
MQRFVFLTIGLLLAFTSAFPRDSPDRLIQVTRDWLKKSSLGAREELNALTDPRCLFTTPTGDVLSKERLIPTDVSKPVQRLPA